MKLYNNNFLTFRFYDLINIIYTLKRYFQILSANSKQPTNYLGLFRR